MRTVSCQDVRYGARSPDAVAGCYFNASQTLPHSSKALLELELEVCLKGPVELHS